MVIRFVSFVYINILSKGETMDKCCEVCGSDKCDGYGVDYDDREFHRGYRDAQRISEARKLYGNDVANRMELEAEGRFFYY